MADRTRCSPLASWRSATVDLRSLELAMEVCKDGSGLHAPPSNDGKAARELYLPLRLWAGATGTVAVLNG